MTLPEARLAKINRFPIKSIGGEALRRVRLTAGEGMPGDRRYGVLHRDALHHLQDGALTKWLPKSAFLRGVAGPRLQAVRGGWAEDGRLHLTHPELPDLIFDPEREGEALAEWLAPLWQDTGKAPPAGLVSGPLPLTDTKKPWLSLLSLSSLADLETRLHRHLGPDRWRGNLWVSGWPAHAERELRLQHLRIGAVTLKVVEPIGRCAATSVDTRRGSLDCDMPAELETAFGDQNFGVYVEVIEGGEIAAGDPVRLS